MITVFDGLLLRMGPNRYVWIDGTEAVGVRDWRLSARDKRPAGADWNWKDQASIVAKAISLGWNPNNRRTQRD